MSVDDEAMWRILQSGKKVSDRRASRGFPPHSNPRGSSDGRHSSAPADDGDESRGSGGSLIIMTIIALSLAGLLLKALVYAALAAIGIWFSYHIIRFLWRLLT